ncbi:hypothetical protein KDAU_68400 [Dictyobacter aurantiacus]|uniref:Uncharacterized protein n=2 Tax=Dictyobacter aurantiacus TaxID=1936993 RepID=A0A401ZRL7_9CHLR|nr:hypothetical protein KDAU_68400 [Dictyobacter aurantiacus]
MAHIFVGVIVPESTTFEKIEDTVKRQLEPFGDYWEVAPYKVYLSKDNIRDIIEEHNLSPEKRENIVQVKWWGHSLAIDEQGIYYMSTYNPQAKWDDWWCIGGRWNGVVSKMSRHNSGQSSNIEPEHCSLHENMIRIEQIENIPQFFALLTPDLHWYEIGTEGVKLEYSEQEVSMWQIKAQQILAEHRNDILVGVDCHS